MSICGMIDIKTLYEPVIFKIFGLPTHTQNERAVFSWNSLQKEWMKKVYVNSPNNKINYKSRFFIQWIHMILIDKIQCIRNEIFIDS